MNDDPYTQREVSITRFSDALGDRIRVSPNDVQHMLVAQDFLDDMRFFRPIEGATLEKPAGGDWTGWLLHFQGANNAVLTYRIGKLRPNYFGTTCWEVGLVEGDPK